MGLSALSSGSRISVSSQGIGSFESRSLMHIVESGTVGVDFLLGLGKCRRQ